MRSSRLVLGAVASSIVVAGVIVAAGVASTPNGFTHVPSANTRVAGYSRPNVLSPELQEVVAAQGSMPVENPGDGVAAYGYDAGLPFVAAPGSVAPFEAQKTEPDKNTYLVLDNVKGADAGYDYGRHFLFQGHELGSPGYITRVNLDADGAHRVTLLATHESGPGGANTGAVLPVFDGSTWDPWAKRLLFTAELGASGGAWQGTLDFPSAMVNLQPWLGRGGFEGIQNDDRGNVYIAEDSGGSTIAGTNAKRPNSFIYRFLPVDSGDLTKGGQIQALQVLKDNTPITWDDGASVTSPAYVALHQYHTSYDTKWITIATTNAASALPGPDDNALARAAHATPFKRPENGLFRPGSKFKEFYFDETGDTNALSTANGVSGGWGSLFKLTQDPKTDSGKITVFYNGDQEHAAFDNLAFFSDTRLAVVEDAGDLLHGQRNALDSAYLFDTGTDYADSANKPTRFIAEGRDASATLDASYAGTAGFTNEGDNEITGIHVSDGDPGKDGILGAKKPKSLRSNGDWRAFWTQQHGDNTTWELLPTARYHQDD